MIVRKPMMPLLLPSYTEEPERPTLLPSNTKNKIRRKTPYLSMTNVANKKLGPFKEFKASTRNMQKSRSVT